ncbi:MAG TPA: wax ester/triacylglycerol synthase family O-acyltransferase [Thermoleophilaceae bacterium]|jgi:diacylglycerol O-acyltransferase
MPSQRLSALDASFLEVETAAAHMHVGWVAVLEPPDGRPAPSFEQLRDHVARRLHRAPRYRQRLARVPLGVARPLWVDDERFDISRHVRRSSGGDLLELAATVMSTPLPRERPLWELWIANQLDDGRVGVVGKAHHCMVDGIAAVELAALLLDAEPDPPPDEPDAWEPAPIPSAGSLLVGGVLDRARDQLRLASASARMATAPRRLVAGVERSGRALVHSLARTTPVERLNEPLSPYRHLGTLSRSLDELRFVKRAFGTTVNDVLLAAAAGGVRRYLERHDTEPQRLKAMVPVNVRSGGAGEQLGNRIAFLFIELPCHEPDPLARLAAVHLATREAKAAGEPEGADAVLELASYAPSPVQRVLSRIVASPHTFNVVVSNIPGPAEQLYMLGCPLREAYPIVPLAERHGLSIGFTTVAGGAFFGVYADRDSVPDPERLAGEVGNALDELIELAPATREAAAAPGA